jgi:hypothetical protein
MKQAEFEKLLGKIVRDLSKKYGWKSSRGFVFKKEEKVFFKVLLMGNCKTKSMFWSLKFKYYEFDDLFWKIVKLEENSNQPLSFRACGVWVAPSREVLSGSEKFDEWNERSISDKVDEIINQADSLSFKISKAIVSPESNLVVIEQCYKSIMERYPNSLTNIWIEKLLTKLLLGKNEEAKNLAEVRIREDDHGGFGSNGKTFFELALDYIETLLMKDCSY